MSAKTAKKDAPIKVKDSKDLSADDIEAKIDAQAKTLTKPKAAASEGTKIEVKSAPAKKSEVKQAAVKNNGNKIVSHKGKMLTPVSGDEKPVDDNKAEDVKSESASEPAEAKKVEPQKAQVAEEESEPANEESDEVEQPKDDDPASEISDEIDESTKAEPKAKKEEPQQPVVFDTNKYHLPIKATHHHAKGTLSPITMMLLLLFAALVLSYLMADAGIYDPGFELPYNFL